MLKEMNLGGKSRKSHGIFQIFLTVGSRASPFEVFLLFPHLESVGAVFHQLGDVPVRHDIRETTSHGGYDL